MPWYICPKRLLAEGGPDVTAELLATPAGGPAALQPVVGGPLPPAVLPKGGLLELPPPCPCLPVCDGGEEPLLLGGPLPPSLPLPEEGLLGLPRPPGSLVYKGGVGGDMPHQSVGIEGLLPHGHQGVLCNHGIGHSGHDGKFHNRVRASAMMMSWQAACKLPPMDAM